ncbi:MAG: DUF1566 domain-containing protein [Saprospiraceae bacterium]|nr:DUF1566 domain-containing protein [Saprospiraceae bacterium]
MKIPNKQLWWLTNFFHQKFFLVIIFIIGLTYAGRTQHMEVEGQLKITEMEMANSENLIVVKKSDGTLATRDATTLSAAEPTVYSVGDYAQGGVVYYVDASGRHGKVLYMHSMGYLRWSNVENEFNFEAAWSPTNGAGNTSAIVQHPSHIFSAASVCSEMAYGGYDDWYLPGIVELSKLYSSRVTVDQTLTSIGGETLGTSAYWSSTEYNLDAEKAWAWKFSDGTSSLGSKGGFGYVRAIRSF